jgi:hypothetical protein
MPKKSYVENNLDLDYEKTDKSYSTDFNERIIDGIKRAAPSNR